jgi:HEAT repeat protein
LVSSLFLEVKTSSVLASILCLAIGISTLFVFHHTRVPKIEVKDVPAALASKDWRQRVGALKVIDLMRLEIEDFQGYRWLLASPRVPERYWLARAMGLSRKSGTYQDLLTLLDDPSPNVNCMAFYSLGRRGNKRPINEIVARIQASDHWYTQLYAYRALRALGWRQTPG